MRDDGTVGPLAEAIGLAPWRARAAPWRSWRDRPLIEGPSGKVAEVGRRWFRVRDPYGIRVAPCQDDALVIAVAIVVDAMAHQER